jgi:hypothetical protein
MGACAGGHLEVVNYLVHRGADIDATDNVSYYIWVYDSSMHIL